MLTRLRTSPALRRLVWGLALLLPLSLNAAAGELCGTAAATQDAAMHAGHGGMDHAPGHDMDRTSGDCGDSVCQATCASTAAVAMPEAVPAASIPHADTGAAPATAPRAGHPHPLLRPPLSS